MRARPTTSLATLEPGEAAVVVDVEGEGAFRRRLMDMGFTKGVVVSAIKVAPLGDPIEYCIGGTHVTLRQQEARQVVVEQVSRPLHRHKGRPGRSLRGGRGRGGRGRIGRGRGLWRKG